MTDHVIAPPALSAVPVAGGGLFPVRRIYCVGRNYAAHAREMGMDAREPPFFFAKPADAVRPLGGEISFPRATQNLHHEVELVVALKDSGADVPVSAALDLVFGYRRWASPQTPSPAAWRKSPPYWAASPAPIELSATSSRTRTRRGCWG